MTWRVAGRDGLRDLGRRLVQPGRISGRWWAAALLLMPAVKLSAGGLAVLFGVTDAPFNLEEATALIAQPGELLAYLGFLLLLGPLPERSAGAGTCSIGSSSGSARWAPACSSDSPGSRGTGRSFS
jgi:hypothetical protein